ncbi:DUF2798 domain-containing protein [Paracoccus beibuensis]|uniref:DUF2798 domain-containing protein n=1 Tax=Paracoccus beibuensis TaxID=547602 RepID=UPI00223F9671|nr:DUF2798 domain-containing protein [Paracoccus beibuensis]
MPRKTILTAQFLISTMMACLMSGYATLVHMGAGPGFVGRWLMAFLTAWPVAFALSLVVSPLAFAAAGRLTRRQ